jgi:ADP-heptose:LPS heptosyltransferase
MSLTSASPARAPGQVDPANVRRVLLIRPRFLGDICITLPALEAVRAACHGARIGYLVERESAPLLEGDPRVDPLFVVPRHASAADTLGLIGALRRFAPDLVLDFFCNPRTAQWTWLSGARVRVGYSDKGWRSALYTHHARPRTLSAIEFHLESVRVLGWPAPVSAPRLHIGTAAREAAGATLASLGVPPRARLVGMHAGARWPTRRWPFERFVELARRVTAAHDDLVVLFTGGPGEEADATRAAALVTGAKAVTGWPLAHFVALQSRCAAFVCGDTGPLHTAVAAGAPTLGLISRNRPAMFFPYPESDGHAAYYARAECSPCHRDVCDDLRCLTRLDVDGACRLLSAMLARGAGRAGAPRGHGDGAPVAG